MEKRNDTPDGGMLFWINTRAENPWHKPGFFFSEWNFVFLLLFIRIHG